MDHSISGLEFGGTFNEGKVFGNETDTNIGIGFSLT